ncbi:MAG: hypothetical protein JOY99_08290 [Sphingomonadaceae bacterium]|nr:hypothetical protein [Sphingomonadaceae bacterium]
MPIPLLLATSAAAAQACALPPNPPPIACATPVAPPPGFAGNQSWPVTPQLRAGGAAEIALIQASDAGCTGTTQLEVVTAGTYAIAMSGAGWIDVIGPRGPVASVAHAHGDICSGVAKAVDFPLQPGSYRINLSRVGGRAVRLSAIRR